MKRYRLCVLGNSHTAAVKQAWDKHRPRVADRFDIRFFAGANGVLDKLVYRDGVLEPDDRKLARKLRKVSGTSEPIEIGDYDGFFLVGLGVDIDIPNWAGGVGTYEDVKWGETRELVSDSLFRAIIRYKLSGSLGLRFARDIRRASKAPMLLATVPFTSELVLDTSKRAQKSALLREPGYLAPFVERCRGAVDEMMAEQDCEVVWQDESTIGLPGFTRKEFGINAAVFSGRDDPEHVDVQHMNAEFGALTLNKALARLDALAPGRVLERA